MDAPQFDALSKALSGGDTRRRVLGALAAVPALGGLAGLLGRDEADARKRRAKHRRHDVDAEKKKKKKKKKKCKPDATAVTCNGKCGSVTNNCKQTVNCGACTCNPACGTCEQCQGTTCVACEPCCNGFCCSRAGAICAEDTGACCVPESESVTCNGKCEGVINNCGVKINCGPCTCDPVCPDCQFCTGDPRKCVLDPLQQGQSCGTAQCQNGTATLPGTCNGGTCEPGMQISCEPYRCDGNVCAHSCEHDQQCVSGYYCNGGGCVAAQQNGLVCTQNQHCESGHCVDGYCCDSACDGVCKACNVGGAEGTCSTAPNGSTCSGGVCASGQCEACDVCADGCPFDTLQDAIDAADAGDTLRLCPETYGRAGDGSVAAITKNLTLVGAGAIDGGTVLDGGGGENGNPVVAIVGAEGVGLGDVTVELRDLRIRGGYTNTPGGLGGGILLARATATLKRVLVTGNFAQLGGGVGIHDSLAELTLINTSVKSNDAFTGGGVYIDGGKLTVGSGSGVAGNTPNDCVSFNGGSGCPA
ncbi:MAG: hypothetical protein U0Z70_14040 [Thermomicrobiales bacterium]